MVALRESERAYRALVETSNDLIWSVDAQGRWTFVNGAVRRIYGYEPAELLGRAFTDFQTPEQAVKDQAVFARIMAGAPHFNYETVHVRKDGAPVWLNFNAVVLRDEHGAVLGTTGTAQDITERKRSGEALKLEQSLFSSLVRTIPDHVYFKDRQSRFVRINDVMARHFGLREPAEAVGKTDFDFFRDEHARLAHADEQRVMSTGEPMVSLEEKETWPDGRITWASTTKVALRDATGQITGLVGISRDITERKQTELARDRSLSLVLATLESTADGILVVNAEGKIETYNRVFTRMWRVPDDVLATRDDARALQCVLDQLSSPEKFIEKVRHLYTHPEEESFDTLDFKDGRVFERYSRPQYIGGQVGGRVWSFRDITERKRAEEELSWRTAFFEAQIDSALDGILVVDSAGKKILQNRRMGEVWKIPPEIADDKDDTPQIKFVTGRTKNPRQFVEKVLHLYSHPTEISRDEIELTDGTVLDRYSAPVRDKDGKYYGRIWTFRDITVSKHLEEHLRQTQKMEAIGQLSGGVAHDFNNLLTAIIGHLGLLQDNAHVTPEIAESLDEIAKAANRAAKLTSQLLAFSRRQVLRLQDLDLNEVVEQMAKMLRRMVGEDVTMQLDYAPEPLTFHGDAGMLEQVLLNLAVNARDAMPGGGTLRIATRSATRVPPAAAGQTETTALAALVHLSVSDTGTGIAPEILPKIFEPFFTTKEVGEGTGLGLATVFGIVQQHRGWIEVKSEAGRGTTFHVYLPRIAVRSANLPLEISAPPARGRGETILLVEDEPAVREMGVGALSKYGYKVITATSGAEALALWARHEGKIALLLTDLIMPGGMSGLQLARELMQRNPALRVIYTSGYSPEIAGKELPMKAGVNYLGKPYELSALFRTVRNALDGEVGRGVF